MALEETQHLASMGARRNSASRFYWRSIGFGTKLLDIFNVSST
ncbi:hypothetical protein LEP1GSC021_4192 [Leptospira noguchii str. 1993005606]|nr:hypothetical protein LEP1GSC021_4192 [Leptospira noguchii str. 1993005606]